MIFGRVALVWSTLALASSANAQRQAPPLRRNEPRLDVVGCYALYSDSGRLDGSFYNSSPAVRLDSAEFHSLRQTIPGWRAMAALTTTLGPAKTNAAHPPSWSADSLTDSLRLSFVNGFSGAVLVLNAPRGRTDTLVGRVFESWDYQPPTSRGGARAVRIPCAS